MGKSLTEFGGTRRLLDAVIIIAAAFFAFQQYASTRAITFVMLGRHRRCTLAKAMHGDRVIHRPIRACQNVSGIAASTVGYRLGGQPKAANEGQLKTGQDRITWLRCSAAEYDSMFAYRLMEALRNHVQHRGLPVNQATYPLQWEGRDGKRRSAKVAPCRPANFWNRPRASKSLKENIYHP